MLKRQLIFFDSNDEWQLRTGSRVTWVFYPRVSRLADPSPPQSRKKIVNIIVYPVIKSSFNKKVLNLGQTSLLWGQMYQVHECATEDMSKQSCSMTRQLITNIFFLMFTTKLLLHMLLQDKSAGLYLYIDTNISFWPTNGNNIIFSFSNYWKNGVVQYLEYSYYWCFDHCWNLLTP